MLPIKIITFSITFASIISVKCLNLMNSTKASSSGDNDFVLPLNNIERSIKRNNEQLKFIYQNYSRVHRNTDNNGVIYGDSSNKCGGTFKSVQTTIQSPDYPNEYQPNSYCEYVFKSPFVCKNEFHIQFLFFSLESSKDCVKDHLKIGKHETLCGNVIGIMKYKAMDGVLKITFATDDNVEGLGFNLLVTRLPCSDEESSSTFPIYEKRTTKVDEWDVNSIEFTTTFDEETTTEEPDVGDSTKSVSDRGTIEPMVLVLQPPIYNHFEETLNKSYQFSVLGSSGNGYIPPPSTDIHTTHTNCFPVNGQYPVNGGGQFPINGQYPVNGGGEFPINGQYPVNGGGQFPINGQYPVNGGGEFPINGQYPVNGGGQFPINGQYPVNGGGQFPINGQYPVNGGGQFPINGQYPVNGGGQFPINGQYPVNGGGQFPINGQYPVGAGQFPTFGFPLNNGYPTTQFYPSVNGYLPPGQPTNNFPPSNGYLPQNPNQFPNTPSNYPTFPTQTDYKPTNAFYPPNYFPQTQSPAGNDPNVQEINPIKTTPTRDVIQAQSFPSAIPQCCTRQFNQQRFYVASSNFPTKNIQNVDCLHYINRNNPSVCRIRIEFKFFFFGNYHPQLGCADNFIEIDGQRICGCRSGMRYISQWGIGSKIIRVVSRAGNAQGVRGFLLDVIQEQCPYRISRASTSGGNETNWDRSDPVLRKALTQTNSSSLTTYYYYTEDSDDEKPKVRLETNPEFEQRAEGPNARFLFPPTDQRNRCDFTFLHWAQLVADPLWLVKPPCRR